MGVYLPTLVYGLNEVLSSVSFCVYNEYSLCMASIQPSGHFPCCSSCVLRRHISMISFEKRFFAMQLCLSPEQVLNHHNLMLKSGSPRKMGKKESRCM